MLHTLTMMTMEDDDNDSSQSPTTFHAHKLILASTITCLSQRCFLTVPLEKIQPIPLILMISILATIQSMLEYIYTGKVNRYQEIDRGVVSLC